MVGSTYGVTLLPSASNGRTFPDKVANIAHNKTAA